MTNTNRNKRLHAIFILCYCMIFNCQYAFSSPNSVAHNAISDSNIVVTDIKDPPLLMMQYYCQGTEFSPFIMYANGFAIWHNESSPTGYYAATLPDKLKQKIIDLAQSVEWGNHYKTVDGHDLPIYKFRFNEKVISIRGDPSRDYNIGSNPLLAYIGYFLNKSIHQMPANVIQLHSELNSFDYADRKAWLPSQVRIEIWTNDASDPSVHSWKQLPKKLLPLRGNEIMDNPQKGDANPHSTRKNVVGSKGDLKIINFNRIVPTARYKQEILELLSLQQQSKSGLVVSGTPCLLNVKFPGKAFETIPMR